MRQRHHANLYDAVAGRVSSTGFIQATPYVAKGRDTGSSSFLPLPPEEVLFRRQHAPTRYEEEDIYWADQNLSSEQSLPDSDLLKAVHVYVADFYSRAIIDGGQEDEKSMDGTALLALGILLEEATKHSLGDSGDLVFVEGEKEEIQQGIDYQSVLKSEKGKERTTNSTAEVSDSTSRQKYKRRKLLSAESMGA